MKAFRDEATGSIFHETDRYQLRQYRSIRAGLSWPVKSLPAYYCIFGQFHYKNAFKRYPLVFMGEGESKDLQELFHRLTDDATRVLCERIYADISKENECYRDAFSAFCSETETRGLYIQQAPWTENFQRGTGLIYEYLNKEALLEITPDSILKRQLDNIDDSAFGEKPEEKFNAINALRFVLGSFEKIGSGGPSANMTQAKANEMQRKYGPPRGRR